MSVGSLEKVLEVILDEEGSNFTIKQLREKIEMVKIFVEMWYTKRKNEVDSTVDKHRVVEFGSCALTPNYRATDVDLLLMGSREVLGVTSESDFENFIKTCQGVTCVSRCEGSRFTPTLVRFKLDRFAVDLQFARVHEEALSDDYSLNRDWVKERPSVDGNSLMGLRAVAVSRRISEIVPSLERFRLVLRLVKRWALRRAIYKHKFGYPGGIAFTILVASACMDLDPSGMKPAKWLFEQFFIYCSSKVWGPRDPVFLDKYPPNLSTSNLNDYMQVFTPELDPWNCTHNVNNSTLPVVKREFRRGAQIVEQAKKAKCSLQDTVFKLFDGDDFFLEFPLYMRFDCFTWRGDDYFEDYTVKALRTLCLSLDLGLKEQRRMTERDMVRLVYARIYPFPRGGSDHQLNPDYEVKSYWIGTHISPQEFLLDNLLQQFNAVMQKTHERQQSQNVSAILSRDLPSSVFPKPWRGFAIIRPKNWKQFELMPHVGSPFLMNHPHQAVDNFLSLVTPPNIKALQTYSRKATPVQMTRHHQQVQQSAHVSVTINRHNTDPISKSHYASNNNRRITRQHHHQKASQLQRPRNKHSQFQNTGQYQGSPPYQSVRKQGNPIQSNRKQISPISQNNRKQIIPLSQINQIQNSPPFPNSRKRQMQIEANKRNTRKISQQNAEKPLPVVINNAVKPQPLAKEITPVNRTPNNEVTHRDFEYNTNMFPTNISSRVSTNPNRRAQANPNPNRSPSPEPEQMKDGLINPNKNSLNNFTRSIEFFKREPEDDEMSVRTDADLINPEKFLRKTRSARVALRQRRYTSYVYNHSTKDIKSVKYIPKNKMVPKRLRRRRVVEDSPTGTPEPETSSSEESEDNESQVIDVSKQTKIYPTKAYPGDTQNAQFIQQYSTDAEAWYYERMKQ